MADDDYPLRILVPSGTVGLIIGAGGATVDRITRLTKARVDVDVLKEDQWGSEKVVTILGEAQACTNACYEILRILG